MKIIVAPDSFKNSMSAKLATKQIIAGIKEVRPELDCVGLPMADGGEGTMSVLLAHIGGELVETQVENALGKPIRAQFGISKDHKIAMLDMASASGIEHLSEQQLNPLKTSSYGTGQLLKACLRYSPQRVYLGVGGSATNDAGVGALQALGFQFLNDQGNSIIRGNTGLSQLAQIQQPQKTLYMPEIVVLNDVANPLLGQNGASRVFGPQKGATPSMIQKMEGNLTHLTEVVSQTFGIDYASDWGTGGAGGLSYGLKSFLHAKLQSGIQTILEFMHFSKLCQSADYVITGEGSFDAQSKSGKVPFGIAQACLTANPRCRVIILAGKIAPDLGNLPSNIEMIKNINDLAAINQKKPDYGSENIKRTGNWLGKYLIKKVGEN